MNRNCYSAGAVKFGLWFQEFRKEVGLLAQGKTFEEIRALSEQENLFGASTPTRAAMVCSAVIGARRAR